MNSIDLKEIIKNKVEKIKDLITEYEKITNIDERDKYEVLIDNHLKKIGYELQYEFKRHEPFKLTSLKNRYEEIKKKKQFLSFQCVRCSSKENMTYYTSTRKMHSRSQFVGLRQQKVTYQEFEFDFPICSSCRKKISTLEAIDFWTLLILLGWIFGFGGMGFYTSINSTNLALSMIYIIIAALGALGFLIGKMALRFLKFWPRRFMKIKVKYLGHTAPMMGKKYEGFPMVKPSTSKNWISYDEWLKSS